jgi:hypothetical protein
MNVYTEVKQFEGPRFSGKDLEQYRYCKEKECWMDYNGSDVDSQYICESHFLSEPLPDFPKPMKMEWRKFEDEMPEEESNILIMFDNKKYMVYTNFDSRVLSIAGPEEARYWMPIIPPEGN